jgi:exonuclease VII large subunit
MLMLCRVQLLSFKLQEAREQTSKGLQPEISRLQQLHDRELADLELTTKTNELALKQEHKTNVRATIDNERSRLKEEEKRITKRMLNEATKEMDELDQEHRSACSELDSAAVRNLSSLRMSLQNRNDKERARGQEQIRKLQNQTQSKIQSILDHHSEDVASLRVQSKQVKYVSAGIFRAPWFLFATSECSSFSRILLTLMISRDKDLTIVKPWLARPLAPT